MNEPDAEQHRQERRNHYCGLEAALCDRLGKSATLKAERFVLKHSELILPGLADQASHVIRRALEVGAARATGAATQHIADNKDWKALQRAAKTSEKHLTEMLQAIDPNCGTDPSANPQEAIARLATVLQFANAADEFPLASAIDDAASLLRALAATRRLNGNLAQRRSEMGLTFNKGRAKTVENAALNAFAATLAEAWLYLSGQRPSPTDYTSLFWDLLVEAWQDWQPTCEKKAPEGGWGPAAFARGKLPMVGRDTRPIWLLPRQS